MSYNTRRYHRPRGDKGEWFGLEIECFIPYAALIRGRSNTRARAALSRLLENNRIQNVTLKGDGSIESGNEERYFEIEINILIKRGYYAPLTRLCSLLRRLRTRVNSSCGLHVHLDCRDLGYKLEQREEVIRYCYSSLTNTTLPIFGKRFYGETYEELKKRGARLGNALQLMKKMVDDSRRRNTYCSMQVSDVTGDRHVAVNLTSFKEHKTIEVRLHQGCLNFYKIRNWMEFLYFVSRTEGETGKKIKTVADFKKELRARTAIVQYVKKAIRSAA